MARNFYLDLSNSTGVASDSNDGRFPDNSGGGSQGPWRTCAKVNLDNATASTGCLNTDGDILNIYAGGVGRGDPLKVIPTGVGCFIQRFGAGANPIVHGGIIVDKTAATSPAANVFDIPLAAGTVHWGLHAAAAGIRDRTLIEGIPAVAFDWDTQVDQRGSNYGCFEKAQSAADVLDATTEVFQNSFFFTPSGTAGTNQDGSGTIRIRCTTGEFADITNFRGSTKVLTYALGNVNGIEIGTQRYADKNYTQNSDVNAVVNGMTLDGIDSCFWPDNGWRSQANVGALGVDVGATYAVGVNSMGYAIRPADWINGVIRNVVTKAGGYHGCMFVGQRNANNTIANCTIRDGNANMTSGGSSGGFYCSDFGNGSKIISGCRAISVTTHKHTLLGRTTESATDPNYGTGTFAIPIGQPFMNDPGAGATPSAGITVTAASVANPCELTLSSNLPAGYTSGKFWIMLRKRTGGLLSASAIAYFCTVTAANKVTILFDNSGGSTGTCKLAVSHGYDGFITHTNDTASNYVSDVEYIDCLTIESGCVSLLGLCMGSAFKGCENVLTSCPTGTTPYVHSSYPVRFTRCTLKGAAKTLISGGLDATHRNDVSYQNCTLRMDRNGANADGIGCLGSSSGFQRILFDGSQAIDAAGNAIGVASICFEHSQNNRLYFQNTSYLGTGTGTNPKYIFKYPASYYAIGDPSDYPGSPYSYLEAHGCEFGFAATVGGSDNSLFTMSVTPDARYSLKADRFIMNDCGYSNLSKWCTSTSGPSTATEWRTGGWDAAHGSVGDVMDANGVYHGATSPFSDATGATGLGLTATERARRKRLAIASKTGVNGRANGGNLGAYQYPLEGWLDRSRARLTRERGL